MTRSGPGAGGAGRSPCFRRTAATLVLETGTLSFFSSPTIRRYPHLGFSQAADELDCLFRQPTGPDATRCLLIRPCGSSPLRTGPSSTACTYSLSCDRSRVKSPGPGESVGGAGWSLRAQAALVRVVVLEVTPEGPARFFDAVLSHINELHRRRRGTALLRGVSVCARLVGGGPGAVPHW